MSDFRKLRNLVQYRDLTDEEFLEVMEERMRDISPIQEFENRIEERLKEFEKDYDIDDLKINDKITLRNLVQAILTLEDYETLAYKLRLDEDGGVSSINLTTTEKLQRIMSVLRSDISNFQNDLKITRRIRKGEKETTVLGYLDELKEKAREFYKQRMLYIFCPTCNMLIGTIWLLYPDNYKNYINLTCSRKDASGEPCNTKVKIRLSDIVKIGTNKPELMADGLK